jgi:hypothetical protein
MHRRGEEPDMSKRIRIGMVVCLAALLALSATGCQVVAEQAAKKAVEGATGVKVDENSKNVTITGKDGQKVTISGEEGKLPEGLPSDFPNYAGTVKSSGAMDANEGSTITYTIATPDSVQKVVDFYKSKLAAAGWTISASTTNTGSGETNGAVIAERGANKEETVIVSVTQKTGADTEASVVLSVKKTK